jgi:hypothetical protein
MVGGRSILVDRSKIIISNGWIISVMPRSIQDYR